eukprot:6155503-Alexandrium_andersonii.AAC.1
MSSLPRSVQLTTLLDDQHGDAELAMQTKHECSFRARSGALRGTSAPDCCCRCVPTHAEQHSDLGPRRWQDARASNGRRPTEPLRRRIR